MSSNILVDNIIINNEKFEDFDLKEDSKTEEYKENDNGNQIKEEKNIININNNNLFEEEKDGNDIIDDDVEEEKKNDSDKEDIKKEEKEDIKEDMKDEEKEDIKDDEKEDIKDDEKEDIKDDEKEIESEEEKSNHIYIKTRKMKKIEEEIEEMYDRISRLKEKLIDSRKGEFCSNVKLSEREVISVIDKVYPIIEKEESMIELEPPLYICGDIHGQFYDLLRVFEILKYPPESKFLFLGDYVDRGKRSLECILLLLCLKIKYPSRIFLLRGNHESANINRMYGFYDECKRKVSLRIYKKFCNLFNILPITALVGEKILCMHGGLAYDLKNLDQLKTIKRPTEIPEAGLLCDLVWSDPDESLYFDFCTNKERGISVCFSKKKVEEFTKENDLDLICRAHQVVEEGFQFFANMKLITVFTAPNYMEEFDNNGGILEVNEDMICSLHVLKPDKSNISKKRWKKISRFIN
jgi:serine/threonine-protein phosphatase PP1 catalytic subunit